MKLTFRWYGEKDCIPLNYIKQIQGMTGVVTAVYDVPVGEVWKIEKLERLKRLCYGAGLEMEVIESIPVHEDIKLGKPTRDKLIANYAQNIINCGKVGVKCVCYNFMPVFDWFRTNLYYKHADGSTSLSYSEDDFNKLDKHNLRLPGWDESYTSKQLNGLLKEYAGITHEKLFENLVYFLKGIMPACNEAGVNMATVSYVSSPTFCTGSLGAGRFNDLPKMAAKYAKRIYFAHLRQLKFVNDTDFYENGHQTAEGNVDIYSIVRALEENGFDGYLRPDHGRNIWGENAKPGYGLFDRALGAAYLAGVFEAVQKDLKK